MKDYNKKNLWRLLALFGSVLLFFLAAVTATVAIKFWWASIPTALAAVFTAVIIFVKGYIKVEE